MIEAAAAWRPPGLPNRVEDFRMGIVSFCPQGHRVKVKDILAGKKGICPTCGARVRIPKVSAPPPAVAAAPAAASLPVARIVSLDEAEAERLPRAVPFDRPAPAAVAAVPEPVEVEHDVETAAEGVEFEDDIAAVVVLHPVIAERPDLAWCHAVPGGAASDPLGAEAMQAWLDSGRADAGALVWRADWPEWRPLAAVFPRHAGR
jgi:hypothetical protein